MVGADVNAYSPLWHSADTNDRGRAVVDFLATTFFNVLNQPSDLTTFTSERATASNMDVTLATADVSGNVSNWQIRDSFTSDHNGIWFRISMNGVDREGTQAAGSRIAHSRINLRTFAAVFSSKAEAMAEALQRGADEAADAFGGATLEGVQHARVEHRSTPLKWTSKLRRKKNASARARRRAQRSRDPDRAGPRGKL